jgi:hypothetical protein
LAYAPIRDRRFPAGSTQGTVEAIAFVRPPQAMYNSHVAQAHAFLVAGELVHKWVCKVRQIIKEKMREFDEAY